jgi:hypothetical protein
MMEENGVRRDLVEYQLCKELSSSIGVAEFNITRD